MSRNPAIHFYLQPRSRRLWSSCRPALLIIAILVLATGLSKPAVAYQLFSFSLTYETNTATFTLPDSVLSNCSTPNCALFPGPTMYINGAASSSNDIFFDRTGAGDLEVSLAAAPGCNPGVGGCAAFLSDPLLITNGTPPDFLPGTFNLTGYFSDWTPPGTSGYVLTIEAVPEP